VLAAWAISQEVGGVNLERFCQFIQRTEGEVFLGPLDGADIGAV
jgi:hypothetical protein